MTALKGLQCRGQIKWGARLLGVAGRVDEQLLHAAHDVLAVGQALELRQVALDLVQQYLALRLRAHLIRNIQILIAIIAPLLLERSVSIGVCKCKG